MRLTQALVREYFYYNEDNGKMMWLKVLPKIRKSLINSEAGALERSLVLCFILECL